MITIKIKDKDIGNGMKELDITNTIHGKTSEVEEVFYKVLSQYIDKIMNCKYNKDTTNIKKLLQLLRRRKRKKLADKKEYYQRFF